jgi:hypothetical protein
MPTAEAASLLLRRVPMVGIPALLNLQSLEDFESLISNPWKFGETADGVAK